MGLARNNSELLICGFDASIFNFRIEVYVSLSGSASEDKNSVDWRSLSSLPHLMYDFYSLSSSLRSRSINEPHLALVE